MLRRAAARPPPPDDGSPCYSPAPPADGCGSRTPWVNSVVVAPPSVASASFHPTARGQQAYATVVARAIKDHRRRG
ncbi:hypothetical protein GCM10009616_18670 [Microlunatus lacustris]